MFFGFAMLSFGGLLAYSGWANITIAQALQGMSARQSGPGDNGFISMLMAPPAGVREAISPGSGGGGPSIGKGVPKNKASAMAKGVAAADKMAGNYPYSWGGGHSGCCKPGGEAENGGAGYDCSGCVSCVLCAMGLLSSPLTSGGLMSWGESGPGSLVTVYANAEHTFMKLGGVWFGTGSAKEAKRGGPAWGNHDDTGGYVARHPKGF